MQHSSNQAFARQLRNKIRYAEEENNPALFALWFGIDEIPETRTQEQRWQHYMGQAQLLLETFADDLIPHQWRRLCLDYFHRPLLNLQHLCKTCQQQQEINQLHYELQLIEQYRSPPDITQE